MLRCFISTALLRFVFVAGWPLLSFLKVRSRIFFVAVIHTFLSCSKIQFLARNFLKFLTGNKNFNPGMEFWPQSLKSALALKHYQLKCFGKYFDTFGEKN